MQLALVWVCTSLDTGSFVTKGTRIVLYRLIGTLFMLKSYILSYCADPLLNKPYVVLLTAQ